MLQILPIEQFFRSQCHAPPKSPGRVFHAMQLCQRSVQSIPLGRSFLLAYFTLEPWDILGIPPARIRLVP